MMRQDKLDRAYEEGYRRTPESLSLAEAQAALAADVLEQQDWEPRAKKKSDGPSSQKG